MGVGVGRAVPARAAAAGRNSEPPPLSKHTHKHTHPPAPSKAWRDERTCASVVGVWMTNSCDAGSYVAVVCISTALLPVCVSRGVGQRGSVSGQ